MHPNQTLALVLFWFAGLAFCAVPLPSAVPSLLPQDEVVDNATVRIDTSLAKAEGQQSIRVKVFPHDRNFAPQFADEVRGKVQFSAQTPCSIYESETAEGATSKTFVARAKGLVLDARHLRASLYIRCSKSFALIREPGLPSFVYEGDLVIRKIVGAGRNPELLVVNIIGLEDYLQGVVPAEVSAGWPFETLKSQAVAARTYAIYHISANRKNQQNLAYDVDDSIVYQAYTGVGNRHERTDAAVRTTAGQVILYGREIIQAYYHADSGGSTAPAEHAFQRSVPYCVGKAEPYDLGLIKSTWQFSYSALELTAKLRQRGVLNPQEFIADIAILDSARTANGRVDYLALGMTDGQSKVISVHEFKRAVQLGSTMFSIESRPSELGPVFEFVGRGSGHGVGMNQLGAKVLAESYSWNYFKILGFYYTGTEICSLGSQQTDDSDVKSCFEGG